MKKYLSLILLVALVGCTHNPIPEGYDGPTARITDTYQNKEATSAHYFALNKVNKKLVKSSFGETRQKNSGRGTVFTPVMVSREVLPQEQEFNIQAFLFYPTDALSLFSENRFVEKNVIFKPEAGEEYFVKGVLLPDETDVWVENSQGNQVGEVVIPKETDKNKSSNFDRR